MKAITVAAVILAGTVGIGIGTAQAGERVRTIELNGLTYRVGVDIDTTWEPRIASETGALPAAEDSAVRGGGSGAAAGVPTYEVGGRTYRAGIDDGP